MTRQAANSVKVAWTGTGTGTMTLGSAVAGYQTVPSSLNGRVVSYEIQHVSALERENGFGTYTSASTTLSRSFVWFSTNSNNLVNFTAGTKNVSLVPLAEDIAPYITSTDPVATNDITEGFKAGGPLWINTTGPKIWVCVDHQADGAIWEQLATGVGSVTSVNGAAGAVVLDGSDINSLNTATNYTPTNATIDGHLAGIDTEFSTIAAGADTSPAQVTSNSATYALTSGSQLHTNAEILSHQANVDFEVPVTTDPGRKWLIKPQHDGCTVSVVGNAGSVNGVAGGDARIVNGGVAIVEVQGNVGSPATAPVVLVRGDVILPATDVGGIKTYDNEDHGQDFRLTTTSTQTFSAAANYRAGFYANIFKETAGNVLLQGVDRDYTMVPSATAPAVATVMKLGPKLIAFGSDGTVALDDV